MSESQDENPNLPLIHKDDLPADVRAALEQYLHEEYPGFTVSYAADSVMPDAMQAAVDQLNASMEKSLVEGRCAECGKKIPGVWPPEGECVLPDGWDRYTNQVVDFLVCGECTRDAVQIEAGNVAVSLVRLKTDP